MKEKEISRAEAYLRCYDFSHPKSDENRDIIEATLVAYGIDGQIANRAAQALRLRVSRDAFSQGFFRIYQKDGKVIPFIQVSSNQADPWETLGHELVHYADYLNGKLKLSFDVIFRLKIGLSDAIAAFLSSIALLKTGGEEYYMTLFFLTELSVVLTLYSLLRYYFSLEEREARSWKQKLRD